MQENLRKSFIYISDDYSIYVHETFGNYLWQCARQCVEDGLNQSEIKKLQKQYENLVILSLQEKVDRIQKEINRHKGG